MLMPKRLIHSTLYSSAQAGSAPGAGARV